MEYRYSLEFKVGGPSGPKEMTEGERNVLEGAIEQFEATVRAIGGKAMFSKFETLGCDSFELKRDHDPNVF